MKFRSVSRVIAAVAALAGVVGFDGQAKAAGKTKNQPVRSFMPAGTASAPIPLGPYWDPWSLSQNRWWDIASYHTNADLYNQFNGFAPFNYNATTGEYDTASFKYGTNGSVSVSYDTAPAVPYFVAHINATGLKPNFAYQMKLVGKPVYGSPEDAAKKGRGFGPYTKRSATKGIVSVANGNGEDWANETIGKMGRWWNDSLQGSSTNAVTDSVFDQTYPNETIYGYFFMGDFVTDANGNADVDITGQNNYHITFQDWQSGGDVRMVQNGTPAQLTDTNGLKYFSIVGAPSIAPFYGYGPVAPSTNVAQENGYSNVYLWYQYEASMTAGRPRQVTLPPGQYRCRLMLTEESFHNNYGATSSNYGGRWKCVLATEDFAKDGNNQPIWDANDNGQPDTNPNNDIVFNIRDAQGNLVAPPAAPTALTATTGTDSSANPTINLSWTAPSGLGAKDYYKIKRSQTGGSLYETIAGGVNTRSTNFSDATVIGGRTYYYVVSAVKSGVEGPNSAQISKIAPSTPITLIATPGNATVALSWTARSGATSYIVKRGAVAGGPYATIGTTTSSIRTFNDSGLINGTPYYYVVLAVNPSGPNTGSNEAVATPVAPSPPVAPSNLTATATSLCQIDVLWQDNSNNETSFQIERTNNGNANVDLIPVAANTNSYFDHDVLNTAVMYSYRVLAVRDLGGGSVLKSAYSNPASASTGDSGVPALEAPKNLTATAGNAQVSLSWTASNCATGYNVRRLNDNAVFSAAGTTFTDANLTNGTPYSYVVSAVADGNTSADSNQASATPVFGTVATPVISPNGGTFFGKATVSITDATNGAAIYYTTNGSAPTTASTLYTGAFDVAASATVKAKAFASSYAPSTVASASFTIQTNASLNPSVDAHVRGGNFANTNYSNAKLLEVETNATAKENRDAYFKFLLSGLGTVGNISSAKLRFYGSLSAAGSITSTLYGTPTSWTESGLTWNNKPALGSVLGATTVNGAAYAWYEIDVTSYVRSELAAKRMTISLALHNTANSTANIRLNSLEATTNQPVLIVTG